MGFDTIEINPVIFPLFFPHFYSLATFSHRRSARIKKLNQQKLTGVPKNLGMDTFPDSVGHIGFLRVS